MSWCSVEIDEDNELVIDMDGHFLVFSLDYKGVDKLDELINSLQTIRSELLSESAGRQELLSEIVDEQDDLTDGHGPIVII